MKASFASIVWIYGSFCFSFSKHVEANGSQILNEDNHEQEPSSTTLNSRNLQTGVSPKLPKPSPSPAPKPTKSPTTPKPTTAKPSPNSLNPTESPTAQPTVAPTGDPTITPTGEPTTSFPTSIPTGAPTTDNPTSTPTSVPTTIPTASPTKAPTTSSPTSTPTSAPTTTSPTASPTKAPTTSSPTNTPTGSPTTANPTVTPTGVPTTANPTVTPTGAPTTPLPSSSPTDTPTSLQPTSSNDPNDAPIIECPSTSDSTNLNISGLLRFRNTNPGNLCTLTLVASDTASFKPVGRSYEGYDWEASSGEFSTLKWTCSSSLCDVNLPLPPDGSIYQLTTFTSSDLDRKPIDELFRFYEQASFGPTPNDLIYYSDDLDSSSLKSHIHSWIDVQMLEAPATSHREIFRERMNVRMEVDTRMAAVTHPCQEGTYYRKFAISVRDSGKLMKVTSIGTKKVLSIEGFVRTVVQGPMHWTWDPTNPWPDDSYRLLIGSLTADKIGSQFYGYRNPPLTGVAELSFNQTYGNPSIQFDASLNVTPGIVVNLSPTNAKPIGLKYFQKEKVKEQLLMLTQNLTDTVCSTLGRPGNPIQPVFALYQGEYWMHDSRFQLLTNTLESPSPDGGGKLVQETFNVIDPERGTACANVARNFLNEDSCFFTDAKSACDADSFDPYKNFRQKFSVKMTPDLIRGIYNYTGKGADETLYVYAIDGLRVQEDQTIVYPCQKNSKSRWIPVSCTGAATYVDSTVHAMFAQLLVNSYDTNIYIRDIINTATANCPVALEKLVGFEVQDQSGKCWKNVHPDHLNVYDFTYWTKYHPGNSVSRNPIKEFAVSGNSRLLFPGWHSMDRWYSNKANFGFAGRLGDEVNYFDLPLSLRSPYLNRHYGFVPEKISFPNATGTIVCGSPNEVAIASNLDDSDRQGSFTPFIWGFSIQSFDNLLRQKRVIWTEAALTGHDQLRQRVAWALAQIFVISSETDLLTESMIVYYDIFVRNAFGNYRDIMKEVSFSPLMANMLTYYGSRSLGIAWMWYKKIEYPDENFAREIMQLFTVGLVKLNDNGTPLLDSNNQTQLTYTNDDIMEYARVWTGFIRRSRRGNMEDQFIANVIDPLMIDLELRDVYPKMGLNRRYIGDGYPLCSDMPKGHFLKKGATYRLIAKRVPEIHIDPSDWATDPLAKRLKVVANSGSSLFSKLCGSQNVADCTQQTKVVLDEDVPCNGIECSLDTVRVVEVSEGIYYEYVQRPCVYEAFFQDPKMIVPMNSWWAVVCADPRLSAASASHCKPNPDWSFNSTWIHEYWGERVTYKTATERTNMQCNRWPRPTCDKIINPSIGSFCSKTEQYFWTTTTCTLRAKIDYNGNIAIVHSPTGIEPQAISQRVQNETKTFFRVDWSGDVNTFISNCQQHSSCSASIDGYCVCDVTVQNDQVFGNSDTMNPRLLEDSLFVGAFEPNIFGGSFTSSVVGGVTIHKKNGLMDSETIFEFIDSNGVRQLRKNVRSTVKIVGKDLSFRNPVHFIHFADRNRNQPYDETDAALDHYFYHSNTAPFLALRFAQRFGISNPSPGFIQRIAKAFRTGYFESQEYDLSHGSGKYGDIGAMILQILLDRESRSTILDADPTHGSLKEPILKLLGLMRGLGYTPSQDSGYIDFASNINVKIGQMAHAIPNVFSFFLPEHKPSGRVAQASLVAPEAQIMTGPRTIDLMNGMLSLIKYGLSDCLGGFAASSTESVYCQKFGLGQDNRGVSGKLSYIPRSEIPEDIVDDLASLLTAGRLSGSSRAIISNVIRSEQNLTIGIVKAQQLIAFAPEFHSTNAVKVTDIPRPEPNPIQPSSKPYKAVVYILLEGGMDSFNMLAPHTCSARNAAGKTLREQYHQERTDVAISDSERSRIINAVGQPCEQFVIHQDLEIVERLYKQGNLAFFANTGVLNEPSNKDNWYLRQRTVLFAHNTMIMELLKIDAYDLGGGTGILGRVSDTLKKKGYKVQPISIQDANVATVGLPGQAVDPLIVSPYGISKFNPVATGETFNPREYIDKLTNLTDLQSSIYGDTWSQRLQSALHDNKRLLDSLSGVSLSQTFPTTEYGAKLKSVASLISSHKERGTDRDVFFVQLNYWDHHSDLKNMLATQFKQLNGALTPFYEEMKAKGYWNNVTVVITSDFARTLTMNTGFGTDHAWGGNYFLMGGSVKGGVIHGNYPGDITEDGPDSLGRGRLIPTLSFESMLNPIWQWVGVETAQELNYCMPNRIRTGTKMFQQSEVFNV